MPLHVYCRAASRICNTICGWPIYSYIYTPLDHTAGRPTRPCQRYLCKQQTYHYHQKRSASPTTILLPSLLGTTTIGSGQDGLQLPQPRRLALKHQLTRHDTTRHDTEGRTSFNLY